MCWIQWVIKSAMKEYVWFWTFCEWRHKWSSFRCFLATTSGPGPKPLDGSISLTFLLETRVKSKSFETCDISHKKTKPQLKIFFSMETRRLARSFEGLNNSLAQMTSELCGTKIAAHEGLLNTIFSFATDSTTYHFLLSVKTCIVFWYVCSNRSCQICIFVWKFMLI